MKDKSRKDIILIITYIGVIIFALVNFEKIIDVLGHVISIFSPFILGVIFAFMLNVLVNFVERRMFGKVKPGKRWDKVKRPLSITISLLTVLIIVICVIYLIIPQLNNSISLFIGTLPEYKEDIVGILDKFDVDDSTIEVVSEYLDNFGKVITCNFIDTIASVITGICSIFQFQSF